MYPQWPSHSFPMPVATELASTQTVISLPSIHQFPPTGSASRTVVKVSANMWQREAFLILSSQPFVTAVARHLINATATLSHPHTGSDQQVSCREKMCTDRLIHQGFPEFGFLISILDEARSRCLTCCGSPETNAHINQHLGNGPPTNRASHCRSAKNPSTVSSRWSCQVMNWSYALNASVAYAVMRACLICSASAFCSALSCLYMAKAPPHNLNGRTHSTFFIVQSSHKFYIFDPLNYGYISRSTTELRN